MKTVSDATTQTWLSGDYAGPNRPVQRAVIQKSRMFATNYTLPTRDLNGYAASTSWSHSGAFHSMVFNQDGPMRELPIEALTWTRALGQDAATCTITLANISWLPTPNPNPAEFDYPGYLTPNRGADPFFAEWGYGPNEWAGWLYPDRLVYTYEGYGTDGALDPAHDTYLYPSGVWLIDDVVLDTDGTITLQCRDAGRMLLDQIVFPPTIPFRAYPLYFEPRYISSYGDISPSDHFFPSTWKTPKLLSASNDVYVARKKYVGGKDAAVDASDGRVHGSYPKGAFDGNAKTWWLSPGSKYKHAWDFLQFQPQLRSGVRDPVAALRIYLAGGPYTIYVSVAVNGVWQGKTKVPYATNKDQTTYGPIPFILSRAVNVPANNTAPLDINLGKQYKNVTAIRISVASSYNTKIGKRVYRTKITDISYATTVTSTFNPGTGNGGNLSFAGNIFGDPTNGNIAGDYSSIVKWICSWAGLHCPEGAYRKSLDGTKTIINASSTDKMLPAGAGMVWGDIRDTGTAPVAKLTPDQFTHNPLRTVISTVQETTGFVFAIDEYGGVVWRLPNIFSRGNFLTPPGGGPSTRVSGAGAVITVDEKTTLTEMKVTLSSQNVREQIVVANLSGKYVAAVAGYQPISSSGESRVGIYSDSKFTSQDEVLRAADLLAIKQMFLYRQNQLTIAANPALQVDDQIIIKERITGEGYLHRIVAITSTWSNETGQWTYQLTTQWLGDAAFTNGAFNPQFLSSATTSYLQNLGAI